MKVRIELIGPGGSLDDVVIDVADELDDGISAAVAKLALNDTLAVGDIITIKEID